MFEYRALDDSIVCHVALVMASYRDDRLFIYLYMLCLPQFSNSLPAGVCVAPLCTTTMGDRDGDRRESEEISSLPLLLHSTSLTGTLGSHVIVSLLLLE